MYRKHFALSRHVFDKCLEPDELFESSATAELSARLSYLIELRGIGLITGEPGSGKTTTCRKVVSSLHSGLYRVIYTPLSTGNVMDLYKSLCWELGLSTERSRAALYRAIKTEITRLCHETKVRPVIVIDEAQNLRSEVLEDLRLLTNYAMDSENRMCLLLIGQAELRRRLRMAVHESFNQRIVVRYHHVGLARDEIAVYLTHMLRLAGTELPLFEHSAIEAIYKASSGAPRKVNGLAHQSLNAAAVANARVVNADHVQAALAEVM